MAQSWPRMDRRTTIKWVLAAAAAAPLLRSTSSGSATAARPAAHAKGYGTDPDLQRIYSAGEVWPLTLSEELRRTVAALCDVIIPPDGHSPAASSVGVVDFIDEWISAPYPRHEQDRMLILTGLDWLDEEARRRYSDQFAALSAAQHSAICDDICYLPAARPRFVHAARFFARYRDLTAGGFYTTPAGHKDLRYVGNVALASFDGPPADLLKKIGLE
jgi:hypothetical protein